MMQRSYAQPPVDYSVLLCMYLLCVSVGSKTFTVCVLSVSQFDEFEMLNWGPVTGRNAVGLAANTMSLMVRCREALLALPRRLAMIYQRY